MAAMAGLPDPPGPDEARRAGHAIWPKNNVQDEAQEIRPATSAGPNGNWAWHYATPCRSNKPGGPTAQGMNFGRLAVRTFAAQQTRVGPPIARPRLPGRPDFLPPLGAKRSTPWAARITSKPWPTIIRRSSYWKFPSPPAEFADPGRHGEMFVSIGGFLLGNGRTKKSGPPDPARGQDDGAGGTKRDCWSKSALAIPYDNLSHMYAELGDSAAGHEIRRDGQQFSAARETLTARCRRLPPLSHAPRIADRE